MDRTILLVQPDFPIPKKRKINHDFLPIGLLKIGTYFRDALGYDVKIVLGNKQVDSCPDEIWVTSLFTYWSSYVKDSVDYYRAAFPNARILVGGIYATLMPEHCIKNTGAEVHTGLFTPAEEWCAEHGVDYSLLDEGVDFQILHGMRGCFRKCKFCGTWKLEPEMTFDKDVAKKVTKRHVVFYDNNFLKNDYIKDILVELSNIRIEKKKVTYESQSGFDGRILDQELANLLHKAHFINPRIAWDNAYDDYPKIKDQIDMLEKAGYSHKDIYVFVLFNWEHPYDTMEKKRLKCWEWQVQISDCRFRPLDRTHDYFNARLKQNSDEYFVHPKWTDEEVKQYRWSIRRHNICVRHGFRFHSLVLERKGANKEMYAQVGKMTDAEIIAKFPDAWFPGNYTKPSTKQMRFNNDGKCVASQVEI